MREFTKVVLALISSGLYMLFMIGLNQHFGVYQTQAEAVPQVAGVSVNRLTTVDVAPASVQPLTNTLNDYRTKAGQTKVREDVRLNAVALSRAIDMAANSYYAHNSPDGRSFVDLLAEQGMAPTLYSCENLLLSESSDTQHALSEWLSSPAHKSCMSDGLMNSVGVATITFDQSTGQQIFVTIFAQQ